MIYNGTELVAPSPLLALAISREQLEPSRLYALGALALCECWPAGRTWPTRPRPRSWSPGQSPEQMGHKIFDALVTARETDLKTILTGCIDAYNFAVGSLVSEEELRAAKAFSDAPEEGAASSESSSTSVESTDSL